MIFCLGQWTLNIVKVLIPKWVINTVQSWRRLTWLLTCWPWSVNWALRQLFIVISNWCEYLCTEPLQPAINENLLGSVIIHNFKWFWNQVCIHFTDAVSWLLARMLSIWYSRGCWLNTLISSIYEWGTRCRLWWRFVTLACHTFGKLRHLLNVFKSESLLCTLIWKLYRKGDCAVRFVYREKS